MADFQHLISEILTGVDGSSEELEILRNAKISSDREGDYSAVRNAISVLPKICIQYPEQCYRIHRAIWDLARVMSIFPASIERLYRKVATGEVAGFTVPAVNMRALTFYSACGVFRAMKEQQAGLVIFELSRGEIGFTGQRPHEYAVMILSAAIAEGYKGPVFLQGDHFQISLSKYAENPKAEVQAVKDLIAEAVSAGFYNIDIDTSTLVDLSRPIEIEQQRPSFKLTAELARFARGIEPEGVTISIGGEIGEIGEHNSTPAEVDAYLDGVAAFLPGIVGLSKLSIQSGTKHGGNILPDGSSGDMPIDFVLIEKLTKRCREPHGLGGCVQHGASMLPLDKIEELPKAGCLEVHLAAAFLNVVYEELPEELVTMADTWAIENFSYERKSDWTLAQFLHHARRYPIVQFRNEWWGEKDCHGNILDRVGTISADYIRALRVGNTAKLVSTNVGHKPTDWGKPAVIRPDTNSEAEMQDLAG